jgi:hypothetical protein
VLLAIADRANDEGCDAWPSLATLCVKTQLHRSTVIRSIERLVELGELDVRVSPGRSNRYRLTMPDYPDVEEPSEEETAQVVAECDQSEEQTTSSELRPVAECDQSQNATNPSQEATTSSRIPRPNTSNTSFKQHTPRARDRFGPSLIQPGEAVKFAEDEERTHRGHHADCCRLRGTTSGVCLPTQMVSILAAKLIGLESGAAVEDVLAWARGDRLPDGAVAEGDDFKHWRSRWNATRASKPQQPQTTTSARIPDARETDRLIEEMGGNV